MVVIADKEETAHLIWLIEQTQKSLREGDSLNLQIISDQTIHSASIHQHTDLITLAVLIYSLNKILARKEKMPSIKWRELIKKVNDELSKSSESLKKKDADEFARHLGHLRQLLIESSSKIKQNIEEVLRRASINKASRIYEHGISLSHTANLLGLSQWEMAEYIGYGRINDDPYAATMDEKKRARLAMDFLS